MPQHRHRHYQRLHSGSPCGTLSLRRYQGRSGRTIQHPPPYAIGECSCTGLHGGNRLASNSLIEAVVYADAAAKHALSVLWNVMISTKTSPNGTTREPSPTKKRVLITQSMKEVNQIMESHVGIVRSNTRLTRAWNRLDILYEETEKLFKSSKATRELCELRNMINVGYLITRQAMERKESRGLHYTIDYPHPQK